MTLAEVGERKQRLVSGSGFRDSGSLNPQPLRVRSLGLSLQWLGVYGAG